MIEPVKGVVHTPVLNQSKTSANPKKKSANTDTLQISEAAKSAMTDAAETHYEVTIKAKCGDLDAQRLIEQEADRKELLGI